MTAKAAVVVLMPVLWVVMTLPGHRVRFFD
jgi:hypothetical protein